MTLPRGCWLCGGKCVRLCVGVCASMSFLFAIIFLFPSLCLKKYLTFSQLARHLSHAMIVHSRAC